MSKVVELLSFLPKGATTKRDLDERSAEMGISVKDFNAKGDGATNDTAAIQACFDFAFGSYSAPHGLLGAHLNHPVFFPPGVYFVSAKIAAQAITNITDSGIPYGGGNLIRVTTATTAPSGYTMANGDMVYIRGVNGVDNANASYGVMNVTATTFDLRASQFGGSYVSGGTWCPPALRIKDVEGALITGAGRTSAIIQMTSNNAALISTNGFQHSMIRDMSFAAPLGCIAFDLNCDNSGTSNVQSNTFFNCNVGGTGSSHCEYGIAVGMGQNMGSENTFLNCYIAGADIAGLAIWNFNSLANSVIGGNIASCRYGILVNAGACPLIHGVSFQNYPTIPHMDIQINNGNVDTSYDITACRTESHNFITCGPDIGVIVSGCGQSGDTSGVFYSGSGHVVLEGCSSLLGYIAGQNASVTIDNCQFARGADYLSAGTHNYAYLNIKPPRRTVQTGTTYTLMSTDGGGKTVFTNSSPVTVTVPRNSDGTNRLGLGSKYDVQQGGTGKVTFVGATSVTINSRGGLKSLNGQWACGVLTCDGTDTWTLEGDIVA